MYRISVVILLAFAINACVSNEKKSAKQAKPEATNSKPQQPSGWVNHLPVWMQGNKAYVKRVRGIRFSAGSIQLGDTWRYSNWAVGIKSKRLTARYKKRGNERVLVVYNRIRCKGKTGRAKRCYYEVKYTGPYPANTKGAYGKYKEECHLRIGKDPLQRKRKVIESIAINCPVKLL